MTLLDIVLDLTISQWYKLKNIISEIKNYECIQSIKLYFNTLCACTSSAWGIFAKILHNIHIEAVTWHLDVENSLVVLHLLGKKQET
jgi:5-keto 4-deoxyuronate isomerase